MRPVHRVAIGVVLASALGILVHRAYAPRPLPSPATARSRPARVPAPDVVPDAPPASSAELATSPRIQLERQCLALAEQDPLAAMEFALKHQLTADDPGLLTSLLMQWAARDFDAAYTWTKTQEAGAWRDHTLAHFAYLGAKTDPLAAARLVVADISPGPARNEAIISVVHQWALQDTEAAGLWARSLADETLRQRASAEVAALAAASVPSPH